MPKASHQNTTDKDFRAWCEKNQVTRIDTASGVLFYDQRTKETTNALYEGVDGPMHNDFTRDLIVRARVAATAPPKKKKTKELTPVEKINKGPIVLQV